MEFGLSQYIIIISTDQKLESFITFRCLLIHDKLTHSTVAILCYNSNSIT